MTVKQIIIDGINVSELTGEQLVCMNRYEVVRLFAKLVDALSETEDDYNNSQEDRVRMWTDNTGLTEKLKRKEQECNKLYIQLKSDEEYHKEEENTLRKIIKNKEKRNIELYKENNKLKVKNEKLKESLKVWQYSDVQHIFKIKEYEQTLIEIKKLAKWHTTSSDSKDVQEDMKQILQKISEVENEKV